MFVITRRDFLKMTMASAAALGLSPLVRWPKLAEAADKKPAVVWLEGQDCAGCTESVVSCLTPDLRDMILDVVCIRYHETIMAGSGGVAEYALDEAIAEGGYVLVVEGSLPGFNPAFLEVAGHDLETKFVDAANAAAAIVAIGACATFGGIPRAGDTEPGQDTQGQGVDFFLDKHGIVKPLINLPGCPVHPTWFWDTVGAYLGGNIPQLDDDKRPLTHFGCTVHDFCPRKRFYKAGKFLTDWNSNRENGWCLLLKGCKGPETHADCVLIKWNEGANSCIHNNAPCAGCTEPKFYPEMSPLYVYCEESLPDDVG
jgi:hydrogenase small subunit